MKTAAAALACCLHAPAFSQTDLQLYGVVDVYLQHLDGARSTTRLQSGGLAASRIGFRGREDLGGGLQAFFTLEGALNVTDGTLGLGGALYGRQSLLGLRGPWGALSAGRHQGSLFNTAIEFSAFASGNAGPSTGLIGGFGGYEPVRGTAGSSTPGSGPMRISNAIRYESPGWQGLRGAVVLGLDSAAGGTARNRLADLSARYTKGNLDALGAVISDESRSATGVDTAKAVISTFAASYRFGPHRVLGGYLDFNDKRSGGSDGNGAWIGLERRWGQFLVKTQYVLNRPDSPLQARSHALGIGVVRELSPRTALYGSLTRFNNQRNAGAGGQGRTTGPLPTGIGAPTKNDINEVVVGLRHSF